MTHERHGVFEQESPFLWVFMFSASSRATEVTDRWPFEVPPDHYIWVHLNLADVRCRDWLEKTQIVDHAAREMMLDPREGQQIYGSGNKIWGMLTDFGKGLEDSESGTATLRLFVDDACLITARRRPLQSCEFTRRRVTSGAVIASPLNLFSLLVGNIFAAMDRSIVELTHAVDGIEDRVLDDSITDERQSLIRLRRNVVKLHRVVTATHRTFARFDIDENLNGPANALMHQLQHILDTPYHDLHNLLERCRLLQDELGAKLSSITNRQLYILTILSTALMPPTLVTGFFGMNTKGMTFADDENATLLAAAIAVAAALVAFLVMFLGRWERLRFWK